MRGHPKRQAGLVDDLARDEVGERHLGRRDQPPAVGGLVAVLGELRELPGAEHRLVAHEDRRPDLGEAVPVHVGVEHELGERPVDPHERAPQHHEAGAGEPAGRLEVEARLCRRDLEVLERPRGEVPRRSPAADLDVAALVDAVGHVVVGQVGDAHQRLAQRRVGAGGLGLEAGDLVLLLGDERAQALELGLVAPGLRRAHLAARGVALGERRLGRGDPRAPALVDREDLGTRRARARAGPARRRRRRELRGSGGCRAWVGPSEFPAGLSPTTGAMGSGLQAPVRRVAI